MTLSIKFLITLPLVILTVGCVAGGNDAALEPSEIGAGGPDLDTDEEGPAGI